MNEKIGRRREPSDVLTPTIAARRFTSSDQTWFARISGDANPIHVDPIAARRTLAGEPVVHGVHALLWAVDAVARHLRPSAPVRFVRAEFERFIFLEQPAGVTVSECSDDVIRAHVSCGGVRCIRIEARFQPQMDRIRIGETALIQPPERPAVLSSTDVERCSGRLQPRSGPELGEAFPYAASNIGPSAVETLAQISALVGMVCPGLHSLLTGLKLDIIGDAAAGPGLSYVVRKAATRYRLAELAISSRDLCGTVNVALRPAPVEPPGMDAFRSLVREREFAGVDALVVGGSRGMGAATAKAIVAGGGNVTLTYHAGLDDAMRIANELGARCRVVRYDARRAAAPQLEALSAGVNQLFYFATPKIFRQRDAACDRARLEEFRSVYVRGFEDACMTVLARTQGTIAVCYPSSEALEHPTRDTQEYCIAKREGEELCARLGSAEPRLRILTRRFPRVATDQTATLLPSRSADPIQEVVWVLRRMRSLG